MFDGYVQECNILDRPFLALASVSYRHKNTFFVEVKYNFSIVVSAISASINVLLALLYFLETYS